MIPRSLKIWLFADFVINFIFAAPSFIAPKQFAGILNLPLLDPLGARMIAAAIIAISGISLIYLNGDPLSLKTIIDIKIIWSFAAMMAVAVSLTENLSMTGWIMLLVFFISFGIWIYYKVNLQ